LANIKNNPFDFLFPNDHCIYFFRLIYRPFHVNGCKKGLFPTRPSSISLKIGIVRDFSKKKEVRLLFRPKSFQKKTTGLPTFDFPRVLHHTFFDNSTSFYCKNLCLGALERLFIEQNSKNIKNQQQFFSKKNLVSMTGSGITQNAIFLKI
jgi:hypothetical protein